VPESSVNFEDIVSSAQGNFDEKNKVLEASYFLLITELLLMHVTVLYN
jgi:hypothetical protein